MRNISLAAGILVACAAAAPVAAGVLVLGSNAGKECYEAARNQISSLEALASCDLALAQDALTAEEKVATYVNRGVVKLYRRSYQEAIQDFDQAMALDPSEPESYLNKASALLRSDASPAEAKALFSQALERETRRPELAFFGRAIANELSGDINSAYQDYKRAQVAAPRWQQPRRELSRFRVTRASTPL